jgi:hypothetical protein
MEIASLVLGIVGSIFGLTVFLWWVGVPLAILGLTLGIVARRRAMRAGAVTRLVTAGVVVNTVGLVLGVTLYVVFSLLMHRGRPALDKAANDPRLESEDREFNQAFKKAIGDQKKREQTPKP